MDTTTATNPTTTSARFVLDPSHSSVGFSVRHMMITNVRGEFRKVAADIVFNPDRPEASKLSAQIDVASIHTREDKRDEHLRSGDFFDVANHPQITFESRRIRRQGSGYEVIGDLTIRGTIGEVTLQVSDVTTEHTDPWGNRRIGASARTKIRRSDFGMKWNAALEAGGVLVGDEITIEIDASLIRQKD